MSVPTLMCFALTSVLIRSGDGLFAVSVAAMWAIIMLAAIIAVFYRVESIRRTSRYRQIRT